MRVDGRLSFGPDRPASLWFDRRWSQDRFRVLMDVVGGGAATNMFATRYSCAAQCASYPPHLPPSHKRGPQGSRICTDKSSLPSDVFVINGTLHSTAIKVTLNDRHPPPFFAARSSKIADSGYVNRWVVRFTGGLMLWPGLQKISADLVPWFGGLRIQSISLCGSFECQFTFIRLRRISLATPLSFQNWSYRMCPLYRIG